MRRFKNPGNYAIIKIMKIEDIIQQIDENSHSAKERGTKFEKVVQFYLQNDKKWANDIKDCYTWEEWQNKQGEERRLDLGIDLVVETHRGEIWPVQCKLYRPEGIINKKDINSFLAESSKEEYARRFLVFRGVIDKNAEKTLANTHPPVQRLDIGHILGSGEYIDWDKFSFEKTPQKDATKPIHELRDYQQVALQAVLTGLRDEDKGKLIMACGSGKTLTSLRIVEAVADQLEEQKNASADGHNVLCCVPSLSLMQQTLNQWTHHSKKKINHFAVCSDTRVGVTEEDFHFTDLAVTPTTDPRQLKKQFARYATQSPDELNIIFCTYQSLAVVHECQHQHGLPEFDFVVCDEAHRTAAVQSFDKKLKKPETNNKKKTTSFVNIHRDGYIKADKRLYMTATPKIYSPLAQSQAKRSNSVLYSMDDQEVFGREFYRLDFGEAVEKGILTDYRVLILRLNEKTIPEAMTRNKEIPITLQAKILGSWKGLMGEVEYEDNAKTGLADVERMKRAVVFTNSIDNSKQYQLNFSEVVDQYIAENNIPNPLHIQALHVDGKMNTFTRDQKLRQLTEAPGPNQCTVISNVQCLGEGVDVPTLDAVIFMDRKNSQVDIVQCVGRAMRRAPGKKFGYVIIPIAIPEKENVQESLKSSDNYSTIWAVLQALRSHDEKFNAQINQLKFNADMLDQTSAAYRDHGDNFKLAVVDGNDQRAAQVGGQETEEINKQYELDFARLKDEIRVQIVDKCGDKNYVTNWAKNVGGIAEVYKNQLTTMIETNQDNVGEVFNNVLESLKVNVSAAITREEALQMLYQHLVAIPVFDGLFGGNNFSRNNPIAREIQELVNIIHDQPEIQEHREALEKHDYHIRNYIAGLKTTAEKQEFLKEIYEDIHAEINAKAAEKHGVVYTPVKVVDFMIRATDQIMQKEMGRRLTDENVKIYDPVHGDRHLYHPVAAARRDY